MTPLFPKGPTSKSYGIHVAKLAGVPESVTQMAKDYQAHLEQGKHHDELKTEHQSELPLNQVSASVVDPRIDKLDSINPDDLTPKQALEFLYSLKK